MSSRLHWRRIAWRRIGKRGGSAHDATLLYADMLRVLGSQGGVKAASATPWEFARSLPDSAYGPAVERFTTLYYAARFGGDAAAAGALTAEMAKMLHEFKR